MKCKNCRNLVKRIDDDGTLYDFCGMVIDSPDVEIERDCKYYITATHGDQIRSKNDEELAEWIYSLIIDRYIGVPIEAWLNWLRQEVE